MVEMRKDEISVLIPEVVIGPFTIKPWSFGRLKKVMPALLGALIPALKETGVTADNFPEVLREKGADILGVSLPALTPLIAATLDISEREVDEMDFDQAAAIGLAILSQNLGRLKNSLPLIMEQLQAVIRAT